MKKLDLAVLDQEAGPRASIVEFWECCADLVRNPEGAFRRASLLEGKPAYIIAALPVVVAGILGGIQNSVQADSYIATYSVSGQVNDSVVEGMRAMVVLYPLLAPLLWGLCALLCVKLAIFMEGGGTFNEYLLATGLLSVPMALYALLALLVSWIPALKWMGGLLSLAIFGVLMFLGMKMFMAVGKISRYRGAGATFGLLLALGAVSLIFQLFVSLTTYLY